MAGFRDALDRNAAVAAADRKSGSVITLLKKEVATLQNAAKMEGQREQKTLTQVLSEDPNTKRFIKEKQGKLTLKVAPADLEQKTVLTATGQGYETSGVLQIDRIPEIVPEARQQLKIRDVLTSRPTKFQAIEFNRVITPLSPAGMVPETTLKPENQISFVAAQERVKTIATFIPASKQIMDDFAELSGFLQTSLGYACNLTEEAQLLYGDNTGENLNGIVPQATQVNAPAAGTSKADQIAAAAEQLVLAKEPTPTFVVLNELEWWGIRTAKDSTGRYIYGDPMDQDKNPSLFGLAVVSTTSITAGTFLVGSGSPIASEIRDREELEVEIAQSHKDWFVTNLLAARAEKRLALVVKRPTAFVTGTFQ